MSRTSGLPEDAATARTCRAQGGRLVVVFRSTVCRAFRGAWIVAIPATRADFERYWGVFDQKSRTVSGTWVAAGALAAVTR